MHTRRFFSLLALTFCAFVGTGAAFGQKDTKATQIASQVQSFYDQTQTVQASFYQTYYHRLYGRYDRSKGAVTFKKPGKMSWRYAKPNGKRVISNGEKLWVYEPGEDGQRGQAFRQSMDRAALPQALSFLTGQGRLEEAFTFRLLNPKKKGFDRGHVLELRPLKPSPHYERVLFYVDKHPKRAGLVHRVLIVDSAGNRNRFDFSKLRFNREVGDKSFEWSPPTGTRIIQP